MHVCTDSLFYLTGMITRLWKYVSKFFSNMTGDSLQKLYLKLKEEQQQATGVGPSHFNGDLDVGKFEAWKRRKRAEADASHVQYPQLRPPSNGTRVPDLNSGILGPPPSDGRQFNNGMPYRTQQAGISRKPGFSSGIR